MKNLHITAEDISLVSVNLMRYISDDVRERCQELFHSQVDFPMLTPPAYEPRFNVLWDEMFWMLRREVYDPL